MNQIEFGTHSFIIRMWREEDDRVSWRGHIVHVPSGERLYIQKMDDIVTFITSYIREMGVDSG